MNNLNHETSQQNHKESSEISTQNLLTSVTIDKTFDMQNLFTKL